MKKILAALVLLALVFGSVAAQEMSIKAQVELDADLLSVKQIKSSDEESVYGTAAYKGDANEKFGVRDPEADFKLIDSDSFNWINSTITFGVKGDNYGATLEFGAPLKGEGASSPSTPTSGASWIRKVEAWLQPASFLKLWVANGDYKSVWRAVNRYHTAPVAMDELHKPYGTLGFNGGFGAIDEFKNGLKADILIGELATIEALIGTNQPLWLAIGEGGQTGLSATSTDIRPVTYTFVFTPIAVVSDADSLWSATDFPYAALEGSYTITAPTNFPLTANTAYLVTLTRIEYDGLDSKGNSDISPYGRFAPNYGVRVTFPVADIGKFYATYRIGVTSKTYRPQNTQTGSKYDKDVEGYDVGANNFGIFADLSPLFGAMDLPLNLVAGYTGFFVAGEKVKDGASTKDEYLDATPVLVSGIDLRAAYTINDAFAISLHNNATFYSLTYDDSKWSSANQDKIGFDKYGSTSPLPYGSVGGNKPASQQEGTHNALLLQENYTYFRLFNELGASYQVLENFGVNLQLANDLETLGYYVYDYDGRDAKDPYKKGDAIYKDTFSAFLNTILAISDNAELDIGLKLAIATATQQSKKTITGDTWGAAKELGKAATVTTTTFTVPVALIVKF